MTVARRNLLQGLGVAAAAAAVPARARARVPQSAAADGLGMLYDATLCIGCKACMVACKQSNGLPPEHTHPDRLYDDPVDLSGSTKTVIKLCRDDPPVFVKSQCMQCVSPTCVSVCMLGALQKSQEVGGVVTYDPDRCIGCRYCQIACPFNVPKFEWDKAAPKIVKCELCRHRYAQGKGPACCEVCPRKAVIFGRRIELLAEAKQRLRDHPGRYVDRVYGEYDGGGTQVLYLSPIPFAALGLPQLSDQPPAKLTETLQHGIYRGFAAPAILYVLLAAVLWRNRNSKQQEAPQ